MEYVHTIVPYNKRKGRVKSDCPPSWQEYNDDWFISEMGDLRNAWTDYEIAYSRLGEDDWLLHLTSRDWFDANTFLPAYMEACRRRGCKVVQMRVSY